MLLMLKGHKVVTKILIFLYIVKRKKVKVLGREKIKKIMKQSHAYRDYASSYNKC